MWRWIWSRSSLKHCYLLNDQQAHTIINVMCIFNTIPKEFHLNQMGSEVEVETDTQMDME